MPTLSDPTYFGSAGAVLSYHEPLGLSRAPNARECLQHAPIQKTLPSRSRPRRLGPSLLIPPILTGLVCVSVPAAVFAQSPGDEPTSSDEPAAEPEVVPDADEPPARGAEEGSQGQAEEAQGKDREKKARGSAGARRRRGKPKEPKTEELLVTGLRQSMRQSLEMKRAAVGIV
ncbi:MAG: hypothetical protein MJD61_01825, partial [Proteobacteria bacterium]|nr:hypothetical protein [Pseudomonadota bacterium]